MKIVLFRSSFFLDFLLFLFIEYLQRKKNFFFLNFPFVETKNFIFSCLLANLFWNLNRPLDRTHQALSGTIYRIFDGKCRICRQLLLNESLLQISMWIYQTISAKWRKSEQSLNIITLFNHYIFYQSILLFSINIHLVSFFFLMESMREKPLFITL